MTLGTSGWTGVVLRPLGKDNLTICDHDTFLTTKTFYDSLPTSHLVIFQTDVLMRRRIPSKFFVYDYVS